MDDRVIWASAHGVVLLVGLAVVTFLSEYWGILIALAPAAYVLVFFPGKDDNAPTVVLASHLIALIVGWLAYMGLAQGVSPTSLEPMSKPGLRIAGSALIAFAGCTVIFAIVHLHHPMAYVTTFVTAIGAFPTIQALAVVVLGILFVAGLQVLRRRFGPNPEANTSSERLSGITSRR